MDWQDVPGTADRWALKTVQAALALRAASGGIFTQGDIGYYWHPELQRAGLFGRDAVPADFELCKRACIETLGKEHFARPLRMAELADGWVKVAYSPLLNSAAKYLNFLPGQYPGGLPNHPSPLTAMLTTGLIGGGLGWAGGKLLSKLFPERYGKNLSRTGLLLGAGLGAAPGAIWGSVNLAHGKSQLSGWPMNEPAHPAPGTWLNKAGGLKSFLDEYLGNWDTNHAAELSALAAVPLSERFLRLVPKLAGDAFGTPEPRLPPTPADVNLNALGQVLWETGANPQLAATTMGAMHVASQLPDPNARPGVVTGTQLAQLTANTVGNYARGYLVGATLNRVVGTPYAPSQYGQGAAALAILSTVVPKLFGP